MGPRLEALPAALCIRSAEALALVQDAPNLLMLPAATLKAGWKQLQRAATMRVEWKEQIAGWGACGLERWGALSVCKALYVWLMQMAHDATLDSSLQHGVWLPRSPTVACQAAMNACQDHA